MNEQIEPGEPVPPGLAPEVLAHSEDDKPYPCNFAGCNRTGTRGFDSPQALGLHKIRVHTGNYPSRKGIKHTKKTTYPSGSKEYKRAKYLERTAMFRAKGLTAQGLVPKGKLRRTMKGEALLRLRNAQKARRLRERNEKKNQHLLNGVAPEPTDNMGESAKAIILAAQVLRSVSLGLKL